MSIVIPNIELPPWIREAEHWLGQHEVVGAQDNVFIVECLRRVGLPGQHDETAWCAAFANRVLIDGGMQGTNSAAARSFLQYGTPLNEPRLWCIQVFDRHDPANPGAAHVNFNVGRLGSVVIGIGGNQGNSVSIEPRPTGKLIGLRWPPGYPLAA